MIKKLGGEDCCRSRSLSALLGGSGVLQLFPILSNLLSPLDPSSTPHIVVRLTLSSSWGPSMVRMTAVVVTIVSLVTQLLHIFFLLVGVYESLQLMCRHCCHCCEQRGSKMRIAHANGPSPCLLAFFMLYHIVSSDITLYSVIM